MTMTDFKFAANFPTLSDADVGTAYDTVCAMFSGINQLWAKLPSAVRDAKRSSCYNLLTAWWLLDTQPTKAVGVIGNGGMAISSKSIGGTSLSFMNLNEQEGLTQLNSNMFGQKALMMIQSAPERFSLYV